MKINIQNVWGKGYIEQLELEDDDFIVDTKEGFDDKHVMIETKVSVRPEIFTEIEEAHTSLKGDDGEPVRPERNMEDFLKSCESSWHKPHYSMSYWESVNFKGIPKSNTEKRNKKLQSVYKEKIVERDANFERDVRAGKEEIQERFNRVVEHDQEEFSDQVNQNLKNNKAWASMADEHIAENGGNTHLDEYADIQRQIDELEEARANLKKQIGQKRKKAFTEVFTENDFPENLKEEVTEILKEADPSRYMVSDLQGRNDFFID